MPVRLGGRGDANLTGMGHPENLHAPEPTAGSGRGWGADRSRGLRSSGRSRALRARRSGLVTTMASPSRVNSRNAFSLSRLAGLLTCSLNSQPRATGAFQVTLVRCQTSVLISGAGACISNQHGGSAYHCLPRHHVCLSKYKDFLGGGCLRRLRPLAVDYHWAFSDGRPSINAAPPPRHRPRNRRPMRLRSAPHLSG